MPSTLPNYDARHPDYNDAYCLYKPLDDVMRGEYHVKSLGSEYLPRPNSSDTSAANMVRYDQYIKRAVFSNITQRMARSLVGMGFLREPIIELPPELESLRDDATGSGLPLEQFAKELAFQAVVYGRAGVLVDYPRRPLRAVTRLEEKTMRIRPYLDIFKALEIINWFVEGYRLKFVVLKRDYEYISGYDIIRQPRWRVLEMAGVNKTDFAIGGKFITHEYSFDSPTVKTTSPVGADGKPFDHITFHICGASSNDWSVDAPPMYPVSSLNLGHYRNSADAEEISYLAGQPQVYLSGLDNAVVKDNTDEEILVGARVGMSLGPGGRPWMLQAQPNSAPLELMARKEDLMEKLGIQLASGSTPLATATQVVTESLIRNSILASSLQNVGLTITAALRDACLYVGANPDAVKFEIDTSIEMGVEEATGAVAGAVSGQSTTTENDPQKQVA